MAAAKSEGDRRRLGSRTVTSRGISAAMVATSLSCAGSNSRSSPDSGRTVTLSPTKRTSMQRFCVAAPL